MNSQITTAYEAYLNNAGRNIFSQDDPVIAKRCFEAGWNAKLDPAASLSTSTIVGSPEREGQRVEFLEGDTVEIVESHDRKTPFNLGRWGVVVRYRFAIGEVVVKFTNSTALISYSATNTLVVQRKGSGFNMRHGVDTSIKRMSKHVLQRELAAALAAALAARPLPVGPAAADQLAGTGHDPAARGAAKWKEMYEKVQAERRRDALDGQATLDEQNNRIQELEADLAHLQEGAAAQPDSWISVEERLPAHDGEVLINVVDRKPNSTWHSIKVATLSSDGTTWNGEEENLWWDFDYVTHWKELPAKPCAPTTPQQEKGHE